MFFYCAKFKVSLIKYNGKFKKGGIKMTIPEIAKKAKVSRGTVYRIAKLLGRLPTLEEVVNREIKKAGRKKKYV